MKIVAIILSLLLAPAAWAACPSQPPVVDASDGDAVLCVNSTPTNPADTVTLTLTSQTWDAQGKPVEVSRGYPIDSAPEGEIYVDGTRFEVLIPVDLIGDGAATLSASGPFGASEVAQPQVTFPEGGPALTPIMLAD